MKCQWLLLHDRPGRHRKLQARSNQEHIPVLYTERRCYDSVIIINIFYLFFVTSFPGAREGKNNCDFRCEGGKDKCEFDTNIIPEVTLKGGVIMTFPIPCRKKKEVYSYYRKSHFTTK